MKHSLQILITVNLLFGIVFVTTATHAQTKLTWKLKAEETLKYVTIQKLKTTTDIRGKDSTTDMSTIMDMSWKVNKVNKDGSFDITQTFDRIRCDMEMPAPLNMKVKWDSSSDKDPEGPIAGALSKTMKPMIGAKIGMTLAANGTLRDIKIPEEMTKAITDNPMLKGMGEIFSADGMEKMMGSAGSIFPDKSVKVGDTWNKEMEMNTPFATMMNKYKYTYKGRNKAGLEEISPQFDIEAKPKENAPFQMEMKLKNSAGIILFDNKAGRIHSSHLQMTIDNKIKVGGKTINQKIVTTMTFKLVDGKTKRTDGAKEKSSQTVP